MGCGCSKQRRVDAQKNQDGGGKSPVGAAGGETPLVSAATTAQQASPPIAQHTLLQQMSPAPSSPGDDVQREPLVTLDTNTQQQLLTAISSPGKKAYPDAGAQGGNQGVDMALSPVVSVDDLPSAGGGGVGRGGQREKKRSSELAALRLEREQPQICLPRFSADPLPQIVVPRGSASLTTAPTDDHPREVSIKQGLSKDDGFRENVNSVSCCKLENDVSDPPSGRRGINNEHGDEKTTTTSAPTTPIHSASRGVITTPTHQDIVNDRVETEAHLAVVGKSHAADVVRTTATAAHLEVPRASNDIRDIRHDSDLPPRHEARPAILAVESDTALCAGGDIQGDDAVVFSDGNNDLGVNRRASPKTENWAETSHSLLDAEEEDFMESLLLGE